MARVDLYRLIREGRFAEVVSLLERDRMLAAAFARRAPGLLAEILYAAVLSGVPIERVEKLARELGLRLDERRLELYARAARGDLRAIAELAPRPVASLIRCYLEMCSPGKMAEAVREAARAGFRDAARAFAILYIDKGLKHGIRPDKLAVVAEAAGIAELARALRNYANALVKAAVETMANIIMRGVRVSVSPRAAGRLAEALRLYTEAERLARELEEIARKASEVGSVEELVDLLERSVRVAGELGRVVDEARRYGVSIEVDVYKVPRMIAYAATALLAEMVAEGRMDADEARAVAARIASIVSRFDRRLAEAIRIATVKPSLEDAICILRRAGVRIPSEALAAAGGTLRRGRMYVM